MLLNKERAIQIMEEKDVDALIASSLENVAYSSDFYAPTLAGWHHVQIYTVITRDDIMNAAFVLPVINLFENMDNPSWIQDVRCYGKFPINVHAEAEQSSGPDAEFASALRTYKDYGNPIDALVSALKDRGLTKGKIGLDEMRITPANWAAIEKQLPEVKFVPGYDIFRLIRAVKTKEEILRITESANIAEAGILKSMAAAKPGVVEADLLKIYFQEIASYGARPACFYVNVGTRTGVALLPSRPDVAIKKGDCIKWDVGCVYKSYWSDTARTIVVGGKASQHQIDIHKAVVEAEQAAIAAARPGIRASKLYEISMSTVRKHKIAPQYDRPHCGHGIGLEFYDYPACRDANDPTFPDLTLEENMVINIENPYYEVGFGSAQVEDTILITQNGAKLLTSLSRRLDLFS